MNNETLTKHFSWEEMTLSQNSIRHGIANIPNEEQQKAIHWLCLKILEPIRVNKGPVIVSSGFRNEEVNRLAGGKPTSQHCRGEAADINVVGLTPLELATWIKSTELPFDQLILEFNHWVHISYSRTQRRRSICRIDMINGVATYAAWA